MNAYGFFCFGVAAGLLSGLLILKGRTAQVTIGFAMSALLPVTLASGAMLGLPGMASADGFSFFPAGLLVAMACLYSGSLASRWEDLSPATKTVSKVYSSATALFVLATVFSLCR